VNVPYYRPTIAEVNLDAITANVNFFRDRIPFDNQLMAVIKADGYGHGAIPIAKHLQTIGVNYFAVAFLDEAIALRNGGIDSPILVLGYTPPDAIEAAFNYQVSITVFTKEVIDTIDLVGKRLQKTLNVHIKVDTGMGRIGLAVDDVVDFLLYIKKSQWIAVEGIFTHFATADEKDKNFTLQQYKLFRSMLNDVEKIQTISYIHLSNSAAMLDLPDLKQTISRLGISLYGLLPSDEVSKEANDLKPALTLKTQISYLKKVKPGQTVSYGATFKAEKETIVATIPIGYADGLQRELSNRGNVLLHGELVPIIGRVCMDQTMIDVTQLSDVKIGDEVIIYGEQLGKTNSIDQFAEMLSTINYELVTLIGKRIPRVYRKDGKIIEVVNNLLG